MSCGVGSSRSSDPELLLLWCRLAAVTSILPLAWEPPYATGLALKKDKTKKTKKKQRLISPEQEEILPIDCLWTWTATLSLVSSLPACQPTLKISSQLCESIP